MAIVTLQNPKILFGSVNPPTIDWSDHIASVTISQNLDIHETTQMDDTAKRYVPGLQDNEIQIEFLQDFEDNSLEEFFNAPGALSLVGTIIYCEITPTSDAVSASNPKFSFEVVVSQWQPLSASVGNISTINVTWPINGNITKTITP